MTSIMICYEAQQKLDSIRSTNGTDEKQEISLKESLYWSNFCESNVTRKIVI